MIAELRVAHATPGFRDQLLADSEERRRRAVQFRRLINKL